MNRPSRRKNSLFLIVTVLAALLLIGASGDEPVKVIYKGPRGPRELPALTGKAPDTQPGAKDTYRYSPEGKPDPFRSFLAVKEVIPQAQEDGRPKTYLETLDLSQLDLIAIVLTPKGSWAMVKDAKGLGYPIVHGTPIGLNGGVVVKILDGKVAIREKFRDFRGRIITREIEKKLYKE
ncbi:MAG: hypothetical protein COZ70_05910 [Deltaproteobacteria bacterium CG_4_8_14_3_um_filter_51_11]|nr:pilus assembly protein PilP [bacterium]OIP38768.1 MAG: hypothetical protein AUK25_12145 [Desulfobacteraceae bacterium CG2_30_51_40]PIP47615.1 MAG: hypothetical protein COX16_03540 [Deltaproteobacteria bacterium CG23_combo_of_CG06-09_8_20_14_all_51_20]PIV99409.1 MAG: hypothetical protein COW41_07955 [Deltaproteobacteria bacterium CG17_big_fil_post_rev_8_21_14_2_50_51_6]PIX20001.1 MAG: hypothetical protein COZ70_05910 [Deltaproteobacteria bacterium CG_4_8_14_3_um_filter_51_11]PIY22861.1 MAG: 